MHNSDRPKRILVVDDEAAQREMMSKVLTAHGYDVDVADSGKNALELANEKEFDVAVLDYRMEGMNGVELFTKLHEIRPQTIGIFLTGYPTIDTVFPAINVGVTRVFAKPVDAVEMIDFIEHSVSQSS
ncbi:MAG: response regulator [Planctomycetota bacterium]|nr:MAG: response regulator [Planctomycetota bacterium]REJ95376.1 MAG: response regulator [Planctomycetota bacterium]REK17577.1 MAG: response regulator [Planctomycetota bacterium]REK39833.1 MAG: response regulator [Planctomycetota bacterium]